jgi:phosphatidylserine/phosphatidylglycerophosphate/cardiolipin synthase-like enzyme
VEVRLLYDYVGSISRKDELNKLKAAGAKVSADVTQIFKLNYRNHRKIVVIDGTVGYTGGMNLGQEYIDGGLRFPTWRDTNIRITGQAVAELQKLFAARFEDEHEDILEDRYLPPAPDASLDGRILTQLVAHTIESPWEAGRRAHMLGISQAARTLKIQSPYFVPDPGTYDALVNAAMSGVDLRFMMTGWVDEAALLGSADLRAAAARGAHLPLKVVLPRQDDRHRLRDLRHRHDEHGHPQPASPKRLMGGSTTRRSRASSRPSSSVTSNSRGDVEGRRFRRALAPSQLVRACSRPKSDRLAGNRPGAAAWRQADKPGSSGLA